MNLKPSTCALATTLLLAGALAVAHAEEPPDGVSIRLTEGPGSSELTVDWVGGLPLFEVYRSLAPQDVTDPGNMRATTSERSWIDLPPVGEVLYYRVLSPCVYDPLIECETQAVDPTVVAQGAYPDLVVDSAGDVHIVYARSGSLYYNKWDAGTRSWGDEDDVGLPLGRIERSDPEIVVDSLDRPHVAVGSSYAYWNGSQWVSIDPGVDRDTALAIDSDDNVFIVRRGGHEGGWLGLRVRYAGSSSFSALPDPDIANGLPLGRNDHVYGHLFVNPVDDSLHVVYRHGAPDDFAYRGSNNSGDDWFGGAVSGDDSEAPSGAAASDGTIYVISGTGYAYRRSGTPSSWSALGRAVSAASRDLPALAVDAEGNLYAASFQGRYNVRSDGSWAGASTLPDLSGLPLGFAEVAGGPGGFAYVIWEEGNDVDNDLVAGTSDILFATIAPDGTVGSN
jgi:hypothetical protein